MRKVLTVSSCANYRNVHGQYVPTPYIRLLGKWMANLGFKPGDKVEIKAKEGLVIVKLVKAEV